jgi:hypothetical protein
MDKTKNTENNPNLSKLEDKREELHDEVAAAEALGYIDKKTGDKLNTQIDQAVNAAEDEIA